MHRYTAVVVTSMECTRETVSGWYSPSGVTTVYNARQQASDSQRFRMSGSMFP